MDTDSSDKSEANPSPMEPFLQILSASSEALKETLEGEHRAELVHSLGQIADRMKRASKNQTKDQAVFNAIMFGAAFGAQFIADHPLGVGEWFLIGVDDVKQKRGPFATAREAVAVLEECGMQGEWRVAEIS